jgi:hypothetical protein
LGDPDLPVDLARAEGQVIAFHAADDAAAQVLDLGNLGHQLLVRIRHRQVRARHRPAVFVAQDVDQLADRAGRLDLGKHIRILAEQGGLTAICAWQSQIAGPGCAGFVVKLYQFVHLQR